jgi:hypothetical protein
MNPEVIIPVLGMMTGIIIPLAVFVWLYLESKDKNKTILEISKNIDDPSKLEDLVGLLDERKKEPIDYRRAGVVTFFTGLGLFLFGVFFLGSILKGDWSLGSSNWYWSNCCWISLSKYKRRNYTCSRCI